jgi:integrase/recombinase XerC
MRIAKLKGGNKMQSLAVVRPVNQGDILQMLLQNKRSENTRRAYGRDIEQFFMTTAGQEPTPELLNQFFSLTRPEALTVVLNYKAGLIDRGLAEATVNRRLSAIKSLATFARKMEHCIWDLSDIQGERVQSYRDTSGVDEVAIKKVLNTPDRSKLKGKRDYAILRLLWENALRRGEVVKCNISDFDQEGRTLAIMGKGCGSQKELISLSEKTTEAITEWLAARDCESEALFTALDNIYRGHRLTGESIHYITRTAGKAAGITKVLSPHRIRHSSITAALHHTGGDVARVQKLSRHKKVETLMIYNDRRENHQGEVTALLSAIA